MQNGQAKYQEKDFEQLVVENRTQAEEITSLRNELAYYKYELDKLKRMIFGSKSERFIPATDGQLALGLETDMVEQKPVETEQIAYTRQKTRKEAAVNHARAPIPAHLPREEYVINPEGDLGGAKKIGEEITEILEYNPGKLFVKKYIRNKYALPQDGGVLIGELPSLPIPKGNAGPGLLAHLAVNKFVDHLPFYRQAQQFKRDGIEIAQSSINGWFTATCNLLEPLYDKLCERIVKSSYLMADETPIPVLSEDKPGGTHRGYYWVYYDPVSKLVCFDYRQNRGREGPKGFLKDFSGYLQSDGYNAYADLGPPCKITHLACMAHARKFTEVLKEDKAGAEYALEQIGLLYKVETMATDQGLDYKSRAELRARLAYPILCAFEKWIVSYMPKVLPKGRMSQALTYTYSLFHRLSRYHLDGRYQIDNNLVENTIRPLALGRKNYLFCGNHDAAENAAIMYSLLGCCIASDVNPREWLTDVLTRIPYYNRDYSLDLAELLPHNWKAARKLQETPIEIQ